MRTYSSRNVLVFPLVLVLVLAHVHYPWSTPERDCRQRYAKDAVPGASDLDLDLDRDPDAVETRKGRWG